MRMAFGGLGVVAAVTLAWACSSSSPSTGSGNDVVDDTRDAARPPATPPDPSEDASEDALYVDLDSGTDAPAAPLDLGACDTCGCSPDHYYCFGGGSERASMKTQASSDAGDGSAPMCPVPDAGSAGSTVPQVGCNALPAGCTTCACVIEKLQPQSACYLVCATETQELLVYCPTP